MPYPANIRMFQPVPPQSYAMNPLSAIAPPGAVQMPDQMASIPIDGPLLEQMSNMNLKAARPSTDLGQLGSGAVGPSVSAVGGIGN
jgi:hypothetical protein